MRQLSGGFLFAYLFKLSAELIPLAGPCIIISESGVIRDFVREPVRVVNVKDGWLDAVELPVKDRCDTVITCHENVVIMKVCVS